VQNGIESQPNRKRNTARVSSEKRGKKTALLGIRLLPEEKLILEAEAFHRGPRKTMGHSLATVTAGI
jgi:hypothetical protein